MLCCTTALYRIVWHSVALFSAAHWSEPSHSQRYDTVCYGTGGYGLLGHQCGTLLICALTRGYRPGGANCGTIVAPLCLQQLVTSLIQISLLSLLESVSRVGPQGIRDVIQHHAASLVHCFIVFKDFSSDVFPGGFRLSPQSCLERTWFQNLALWFMFGLISFGDLFL